MKHKPFRISLLVMVLVAAVSVVAALATYSPNGRELLSLSYLENTVLPQAVTTGEAILDQQEQDVLDRAESKLDSLNSIYQFQLRAYDGSLNRSPSLMDFRFKRDDIITIGTGSNVLLLAGEAEFFAVSGSVVDASEGVECSTNTPLWNLPDRKHEQQA